jgi:hypothetical protein
LSLQLKTRMKILWTISPMRDLGNTERPVIHPLSLLRHDTEERSKPKLYLDI